MNNGPVRTKPYNFKIKVYKNDIDGALRVMKKKLKEYGTLEEYKNRQEYIKPSAKRRRAKLVAKIKQKKADKLMDL